jgi:hypothetical protein
MPEIRAIIAVHADEGGFGEAERDADADEGGFWG